MHHCRDCCLKVGNSDVYYHMMSEFWKRKMRTYFSTFDFDKDGVISKDDWLWMTVPKVENAKEELADQLRAHFVNVWELFMQHNEAGGKNKLNVETLLKVMEKLRYNPDLIKHFTGLVKYLFYMIDANGDGFLQEDEYERMAAQCGMKDTSFVKEAFKAVDINGDGKLSLEELVNAFFSFMFSDDENDPRKLFVD